MPTAFLTRKDYDETKHYGDVSKINGAEVEPYLLQLRKADLRRRSAMTIDRACEILDPEHREHYESIDPVNEACRMAINALRAQEKEQCGCEDYHEREIGAYLKLL